MKEGVVYYPAEIYEALGITQFQVPAQRKDLQFAKPRHEIVAWAHDSAPSQAQRASSFRLASKFVVARFNTSDTRCTLVGR